MTGRRGVAAAIVGLGIVLSSCTPTTDADPTSSTVADEVSSTTVPLDTQPLPGPRPDRAAAVAHAALIEVGDWIEVPPVGVWEADAVEAITRWFPASELSELASAVYEMGDARVVVVSLIPVMLWRGDPTFIGAIAAPDIRSEPQQVADRVYRLELPGGLIIDLWSDGDGLLAAASLDEQAQTSYLAAREEARKPLTVWSAGTCLDLPDEYGLPWAPFPVDAIVDCDDPHNAEVIHSIQVATDLAQYDEDAITQQRAYDCDRAYEETFGPQRDLRPSLITYMPDGDEWDRGDRYLACVVQLNEARGTTTMSGPMVDRADLEWSPEVGQCFSAFGDAGPVPCEAAHAYELIGTVEYEADRWPQEPASAFDASCAPFLEGLAAGPGTVETVPSGLYPYAFENGEREIRCFAIAVTDEGIADVLGSFRGSWVVLGTGGIAV